MFLFGHFRRHTAEKQNTDTQKCYWKYSNIYVAHRGQRQLLLPQGQSKHKGGRSPFRDYRHHLPWDEPLGGIILDTLVGTVIDGLRQKPARDSQPVRNRCVSGEPSSVPLLPARPLKHFPPSIPHLANLQLSTFCQHHARDRLG